MPALASAYPAGVDELTHPGCDRCGALLPRDVRHFHKLWHDNQTGLSTRFFGDQDVDPPVSRLLQVAAALRAVPSVTARPEFVRDLRGRLMAGTSSRHLSSLATVASHSENE